MRCSILFAVLGLGVLACGGGAPDDASTDVAPLAEESGAYRATPVVVQSGVYDANETTMCSKIGGGCVNAFMYFAEAPATKTGALPRTLDGVETYDVDAWASNFQGANRVRGESADVQWEWSIDNTESSSPRYLGRGQCADVRAQGLECWEAYGDDPRCDAGCTYYEHDGRCECSARLHLDPAAGLPAIATTWGSGKIAQVSSRTYPLVFAIETVSDPARFTTKTLT